jgi:hypothetical protein
VKVTLISVAVLITLLLVMLVWIGGQPPPPRPAVSLAFVGYTNDARHQRVAVFTLTNSGSCAVQRNSSYHVYVRGPDAPARSRPMVESGYLTNGGALLPPAASETWSIAPPTNQGRWYVSVGVRTDEPLIRDMADSILQGARSIGIRARYRQPNYGARSEDIE